MTTNTSQSSTDRVATLESDLLHIRGPYPIERDKPPTEGYLGRLLAKHQLLWRAAVVALGFLVSGAGGSVWAIKAYYVSQGVELKTAAIREERLSRLEDENRTLNALIQTLNVTNAEQELRLRSLEERLRRRVPRDTQDP